MVEKRKKMHQELMSEIRQQKNPLLKTIIPYAADVEKMGIHRKPIFQFRRTSTAAMAYRNLWKELTKKLK